MKIKTKRIIAQMVAGVFASMMIGSFGMALHDTFTFVNKKSAIDEKLSIVCTNIKKSSEFESEYINYYNKYSQDYIQNVTTLDEHIANLKYLESDEFIEDFISSHSEHENADTFTQLQSQKTEVVDTSKNTALSKLGLGIMCGITGAFPVGHSLRLKELEEQEREKMFKEFSK